MNGCRSATTSAFIVRVHEIGAAGKDVLVLEFDGKLPESFPSDEAFGESVMTVDRDASCDTLGVAARTPCPDGVEAICP